MSAKTERRAALTIQEGDVILMDENTEHQVVEVVQERFCVKMKTRINGSKRVGDLELRPPTMEVNVRREN